MLDLRSPALTDISGKACNRNVELLDGCDAGCTSNPEQRLAMVTISSWERKRAVQNSLRGATVVFDLDGTLVDTLPDLTNSLNYVLTHRGYDAVQPDTVRWAVGHGARAMIEDSLASAGAHDDIDQMLDEFLVNYEANIAAESRPFPGAVASLEALVSAGARLALCTNKLERLTRKLIASLELDHYFDGVAGRDTFAVSKPNPAHLTGAIGLAGGERTRAVMVGDSYFDMCAAHGADIPSILVGFGYGAGRMQNIKPDAIIDRFDALAHEAEVLLTTAARVRKREAAMPQRPKAS